MKKSDLAKLVPKAMEAAETLKALAHESRLLAVCFIGDGEKSVQDIETFLACSQSSVSQHLSRLKAAGILKSRRAGKLMLYSAATPGIFLLVEALQTIYCPPVPPVRDGKGKRT